MSDPVFVEDVARQQALGFLTVLGLVGILHLVLAAVVASAASRMGARRGRLGRGLLDMGPTAWFVCVLFFGPAAAYLWASVRPALHVANQLEATQTVAKQKSRRLPAPATHAQPGWFCPSCGRQNPASEAFCGADGAPRPTAAAEPGAPQPYDPW